MEGIKKLAATEPLMGVLWLALRLFINYILAGSTSANGYMLVAELVMLFAEPALTYYALDRWVLPFLQRALTGADAEAERAPAAMRSAGGSPGRSARITGAW